eukprot:scaffold51_cov172-Ochromonas_danica.AAC.15
MSCGVQGSTTVMLLMTRAGCQKVAHLLVIHHVFDGDIIWPDCYADETSMKLSAWVTRTWCAFIYSQPTCLPSTQQTKEPSSQLSMLPIESTSQPIAVPSKQPAYCRKQEDVLRQWVPQMLLNQLKGRIDLNLHLPDKRRFHLRKCNDPVFCCWCHHLIV